MKPKGDDGQECLFNDHSSCLNFGGVDVNSITFILLVFVSRS